MSYKKSGRKKRSPIYGSYSKLCASFGITEEDLKEASNLFKDDVEERRHHGMALLVTQYCIMKSILALLVNSAIAYGNEEAQFPPTFIKDFTLLLKDMRELTGAAPMDKQTLEDAISSIREELTTRYTPPEDMINRFNKIIE